MQLQKIDETKEVPMIFYILLIIVIVYDFTVCYVCYKIYGHLKQLLMQQMGQFYDEGFGQNN